MTPTPQRDRSDRTTTVEESDFNFRGLLEPKEDLPNDVEMSIWDHFAELRLRIFYSIIAVAAGFVGCFAFVNQIVRLLERPAQNAHFLQLSPGEYFFVSVQVAGYSGLLIASPIILYQIVRFILPGLTLGEQKLLAPIVFGSTFLFAGGLFFAYQVLIPATLRFFESYGSGVVEQMWSIDRYFQFVLALLFLTGLIFQVPVIQYLLGRLGLVSAKQMLYHWRSVILGAAIAAAIITPSTDPLTQILLGLPITLLYFGGAGLVALTTPKPPVTPSP